VTDWQLSALKRLSAIAGDDEREEVSMTKNDKSKTIESCQGVYVTEIPFSRTGQWKVLIPNLVMIVFELAGAECRRRGCVPHATARLGGRCTHMERV
jgi:hypothetical protein